MIGGHEEYQDQRHGERQSAPEQSPFRATYRRAGLKPKAGSEVSDQIAHAAGHQGHQSLSPGSPDWLDSFVEIDLGGDEEKRER